MVDLRVRSIKNFINHFYHFILFCDKRLIIYNIFNFFRAFLKRERVFEFYLKNNRKLTLSYLELINLVYTTSCKSFLLIGEVRSDSKDYENLGINFKNKVILDVGAWIGDSILLFHKLGAKKIIAYEPIKENVEFAKKMVEKFNINCRICPYAVCDKNGEIEFYIEESEYELSGMSLFKKEVKKPKLVKVRCVNWKFVLEHAIKERVDIAKVDCEGCEKFLVEVDKELIRKIPEWIIECHNLEIVKKVYKKFIKNGYKLAKVIIFIFPEIAILYFILS